MDQEICLILGQVSLNLLNCKKNFQTEKCGPGRLTRKQLTSRPDHSWPELWEKMGKNAKLKEKQKWSHEKPHVDNARKLRLMYFIDPAPMAPGMPCKISKNKKKCENGESNKVKSKLACILEASESTRLRMVRIIADSS